MTNESKFYSNFKPAKKHCSEGLSAQLYQYNYHLYLAMQANAYMILCFHWYSILAEKVGELGQIGGLLCLVVLYGVTACVSDTFFFNSRNLKFVFTTRAQLLNIS